jgi:hypothetical protein
MLTSDKAKVVDKLEAYAEKFNEAYREKKYRLAMWFYTQAFIAARFEEVDKDIEHWLFGYGNTDETDYKGIFNRDMVSYAHGWCIKNDVGHPFVDAYTVEEMKLTLKW